MKKTFIIILFGILLSSCNPSIGNEKKLGNIKIIGYYSNRTTSMCSQNCQNISVGPFGLTQVLSGINSNDSKKFIYIEGDIIETKELPTVAGPFAEPSKKLEKVNKVKTKKFKLVEEPKFSISKIELKKYVLYEKAEIKLNFSNPIDQDLSLKLIIKDGKAQKFNIKANEKKEITFYIDKEVNKNDRDDEDYIEYLIVNDWAEDTPNYYKDYTKLTNKTVIFINDFINLKEIAE